MKGLLSVSFGTSYEDTRAKTIDVVDARLADAFADRAFYSAWTSGHIIAKVRAERGEQHDTLDEAFARLSADGVDDLVVSTMCLMRGHEMRKIERAVEAWLAAGEGRVAHLAEPLLVGEEDRKAFARIVCEEFSAVAADEALLLMGHGSPGNAAANEVYVQVQREMAALGRPNFLVATVEGEPCFEDVLPRIRESAPACVHLAPFMIVAGDHAKNDLAGDEDDSWKSMLEAQGFKTRVVLRGLGEYVGVHDLVVEHARAAVAANRQM